MAGTERALLTSGAAALLLSLLLAFVPNVSADNGVTSAEVVIGMCNALSGPASALGTGIKKGSLVYFNKVNKAGGVNGRRIRVISYDDGKADETLLLESK